MGHAVEKRNNQHSDKGRGEQEKKSLHYVVELFLFIFLSTITEQVLPRRAN